MLNSTLMQIKSQTKISLISKLDMGLTSFEIKIPRANNHQSQQKPSEPAKPSEPTKPSSQQNHRANKNQQNI